MPQTLPLTITKTASVLDGMKLIECIPKERIQAILKSDQLLPMWRNRFHEQELQRIFSNEGEQLIQYLRNYVDKVGGVPVKYKKPRNGWGRVYPDKSCGLTSFRRKIRNTLINDLYYDFDLKNAHPTILRNLCKSNGIPHPQLEKYCDQRNEILQEVQSKFNVSKDVAKELFIRICYSGTFQSWCIENGISAEHSGYDFASLFENEIQIIAKRIKKENPQLWDCARKKDRDNQMGTFMSLYNQEWEQRILEKVMCEIWGTELMNMTGGLKSGTYEFDGIKLPKNQVEEFGGISAVVDFLNMFTNQETGFTLEWVHKPTEGVFELDELIEEVSVASKPNELLSQTCSGINNTISRSDTGIIELINKILPNHYVYSIDKIDPTKGTWYCWDDSRWVLGDAPLRRAIIYKVEEYWATEMKTWNDMFKGGEIDEEEENDPNYKIWSETTALIKKRLFMLHGSGGVSSCVSIAKSLLQNDRLEFDANPDLIGFENGVFDIATGTFRRYRFDDYITMSAGYNLVLFTPPFKMENSEGEIINIEDCDFCETSLSLYRKSFETITNAFNEIMPDEDMRNFLFKILSTGFSGRAIEKFFVFNGSGRNGKGLTNEFMERVLGDYFASVSPLIFSEDPKKKSTSTANPELAKLNKARYVVAKEPAKDCPLNNSTIKDMTGGGSISARMLYSSHSIVRLFLTLVMECNKKPPFKEDPTDADAERIVDLLFGSKFSSDEKEWDITTGENNHIYPVSADLKNELKTSDIHRNTMANILLVNLMEVRDVGYNMNAFRPECVKERSLEYIQNSYDIHNIFQELFEKRVEENKDLYINYKGKTEDCDWTLSKIAVSIRKSSSFISLDKRKQKEYSAKAIEEFLTTNVLYKKYVYKDSHKHAVLLRGWRLIPVLDSDTEEEEEK